VKYIVEVEAATFFHRLPRGVQRGEVEVGAGKEVTADVKMEAGGVFYGRVVDAQGAGVGHAVVGVASTLVEDERLQWRAVEADGDGFYAIATGHTGEEVVQLQAYLPEKGRTEVRPEPLVAGASRRVNIVLRGAMHLHGQIVDEAGEPVKNVGCFVDRLANVGMVTGEDGRFDLGWVPLADQQELWVRGARPAVGGVPTWGLDPMRVEVKDRATAPVFYAHTFVPLPPLAGDMPVKVALKRADLLEVGGVVKDGAGAVVAGANVFVFTGDAGEKTWLETAMPPMADSIRMIQDTLVGSATTDKEGRWRLWDVRGGERGGPRGMGKQDWDSYAVGVVTPDDQHAFVKGVTVAPGKEAAVVDMVVKEPLKPASERSSRRGASRASP
jgi:hypothetical protein